MKTCSKCGEVKPLDLFGRDAKSKDGLDHRCKPCKAAAKRALADRVPALPASGVKTCGACSSVLPLNAFSRDASRKDGLQQKCKPCASVYDRALADRVHVLPESGMKACTGCAVSLPLALFSRNAASKDGLAPRCKACDAAYHLARTASLVYVLPESGVKTCAGCLSALPVAAFHHDVKSKDGLQQKCKPCAAASDAAWGKANPGKANAITATRRARKLRATVGWSETREIEALYTLAKDSEKLLGGVVHVDHIVPLYLKNVVCGLHVRANLRLLDGPANCGKGNRFNPMTFVHVLPDGIR